MALQSITAAPYPGLVAPATGAFALSTTTLDAAGEYVAGIFKADQDMTISHVGFLPGTVSGSGTLDIRIETVDSGGDPSGTLWGTTNGGAGAATNIAGGSLTSSTWSLQALTNAAVILRGDVFAVKLAYNSGTSVIINRVANLGLFPNGGLPYRVTNTGTPTKSAIVNSFAMALGSSSTSFYAVRGMFPATANVSSVSGGSGTMSALGMRFRLPVPARIRGLFYHPNNSSLAAMSYGLYTDAWSEVNSSNTSLDVAKLYIATGTGLWLPFDSSPSIAKDTWYRLAVLPGSATAIRVPAFAIPSANYASALPFNGNCHVFTRDTGGTLDDTTYALNFPIMDIVYDELADDVGSGGGSAGVIGS